MAPKHHVWCRLLGGNHRNRLTKTSMKEWKWRLWHCIWCQWTKCTRWKWKSVYWQWQCVFGDSDNDRMSVFMVHRDDVSLAELFRLLSLGPKLVFFNLALDSREKKKPKIWASTQLWNEVNEIRTRCTVIQNLLNHFARVRLLEEFWLVFLLLGRFVVDVVPANAVDIFFLIARVLSFPLDAPSQTWLQSSLLSASLHRTDQRKSKAEIVRSQNP